MQSSGMIWAEGEQGPDRKLYTPMAGEERVFGSGLFSRRLGTRHGAAWLGLGWLLVAVRIDERNDGCRCAWSSQ